MRFCLFAFVLLCSCPLTAPAGMPDRATVATILQQEPATSNRTWMMHGRIVARGPTSLTVDDGTGLITCAWYTHDLQAGDEITFALSTPCRIPNAETNILFGKLYAVTKTGHGAPPAPVRTTLPKLLDGSLNARSVTVEGVITDIAQDEVDPDWIRLTLESEGARMAITYSLLFCNRRPEPSEWIDTAVRITGYFQDHSGVPSSPRSSGARKNIGGLILIDGLDDIRRLDSPQADRFRFPHRERIVGTVIAAWNGESLFLRTQDDQRLRINLQPGASLPPVGSEATLVGFRRSNDFFDWIANASILSSVARTDGIRPPEGITAFVRKKTGLTIDPNANGRIVRVVGRIKDVIRTETGRSQMILDVDGANVPVEAEQIPTPPVGSRIAAVGCCLIAFEPNLNDNVHVRLTGISVIPRTADDISVLSRPSWWTRGRLLAVIFALLAGLVAVFIWIRILQRLVERRGRQLLRAQIEGERSNVRIGERTRLAVELHDSLSQNLTGVSFQLDSFRFARNSDADAAERHLETAERILHSCRTELRRCLWDLRSDALEEPDFVRAIRKVLQPFLEKAEFSIRFHLLRSWLSDTAAHAILRILRELSANAIVHGKARRIRIAGSFENGAVLFSVTDDGCGFDPAHCPGPSDGHFGIVGIRERIRELHGDFELKTSEGGGTKVRIRLPIQQKPSDELPS